MNICKLASLALTWLLASSWAVSQTATSAATTAVAAAPTPVPSIVPYSGTVDRSSSNPLAGEAAVTFLIFKDETGGEPLFAETQTVTLDPTGHYQVQLGGVSPNGLPSEIFSSGEARWLEVQVAGETPQPRVLLASVPYAMKAADAATLDGLPASAFALAGQTLRAAATQAGATPDTASNVTTTGGAAGYVPGFSGATTIVDSPIFVNGSSVGINTTAPASTLDVNGPLIVTGDSTLNGQVWLPAQGTATASSGFNSQVIKFYTSAYNSSTRSTVSPRFQWQALVTGNDTPKPGATLSLFSSTTSALPTATGFSFNVNGTMNFAPGQTFPGADITGTINASSYDLGGSPFATGNLWNENAYLGFAGNTSSGNTGTSNTGVGDQSLAKNTTGAFNTANGEGALTANTTGNDNTATGANALASNTIGYGNTASGFFALLENVYGDENTGVGTFAGPDPSSTALSNSTAIGYSATVSQSNTLVLGETAAGSPGEYYVNVGIGTATPRSELEAVVNSSKALGPTITLTNSGSGANTAASIDFNTDLPSTTGTYNPGARIEAVDDGNNDDGTNMVFLNNVPGAVNNGLQTNMVIASNGEIAVGAVPGPGTDNVQFTSEGVGGSAGIWGLGSYVAGEGGGAYGGIFHGGHAAGTDDGGYGLLAQAGGSDSGFAGYAGVFSGDVSVTGTLTASSKDFKIDDPLDPANKYLYHSSVESSEQMNIYTGNVVTDELGLATVKLPGWFEAENADFRYQLTVIGRQAQAWVAEEVANGQFKIASNATNTKISWQITAVRQDAYAQAHPLVIEQEKPAKERGFYQNPELFGQPEEKQIEWAHHPQQMRHVQQMRERQKLQAEHPTGPALSHDQPASAVNKHFTVPAAPVRTLPQHPTAQNGIQPPQTISQLNK